MDAHRYDQGRKRAAWLSPYLLLIALSPALMQTQSSCEREDPVLSWLEFEVEGQNQIIDFHPYTASFEVSTSSPSAILRVITKPNWLVTYEWIVGGTPMGPEVLGFGANEATVSVPPGDATLRVIVYGRKPALDNRTYDINVTRRQPCTEQGILDAIVEGGGPHTFACNGPTTVVTQGEIVIDNDVILNGEGNLTVDGNDDHRVLAIAPGVTAELVGITVANGYVEYADGAGIRNEGTLTIRDGVVERNRGKWGADGGGIYSSGTLTMLNSVVRRNGLDVNSTDEGGAGIFSTGTVTLVRSEVSRNSAVDGASGIHSTGTLTLIDTEVVDNNTGDGPTIHSRGESLTLIRSTVSTRDWWAIRSRGTATVINSTIEGDAFDESISHHDGTFTLIGSTVTRGECCVMFSGGEFFVSNSVISYSSPNNYCSVITSGGGNIESPGDICGFDHPTDLVNVSAAELNLGPLQDNGGPTMTRALLPGSIAIDHVPPSMCLDENGDPLTTDQRGVARPQGAACDVGAFESQCSDVDCDDGNECTADVCDPADGLCTNDPVADGTSCDFGGVDGVCDAGNCIEDDRLWSTEELLENDDATEARAPSVAVDPSGNAIAVWSRVDGALYSTWANHYAPGEGWGSPVSLGPANYHGGDPGPRIGMANNGNAIAIWRRNCGTGAAVYQPEIGWGAPENIQAPGVCTLRADLAVNAGGDAIAVWENSAGGLYSVWANRFSPSAGWGTPERISDYGPTLSPRVAINSDGYAIAVWDVDKEMWANRFSPSAGWGTPEQIATTSANSIYGSVVAVNERGDAVAAWTQWGPNQVWANWFTVATGWGIAERVSFASSGSFRPAAVIDSQGHATVLGGGIFANRFIPNSGWGTPEVISSLGGSRPQIALDLNGHVTAVWVGSDGATSSIFASRWTSVGGWEAPQVIENLTVTLSLANPSIAVSAYGDAVAVWDAPNDFSSIWSNRFE